MLIGQDFLIEARRTELHGWVLEFLSAWLLPLSPVYRGRKMNGIVLAAIGLAVMFLGYRFYSFSTFLREKRKAVEPAGT